MSIQRGWGAKFRYRSDEFLSGGAGRQLFFLFVLTMTGVVFFTSLSRPLGVGPTPEGDQAPSFLDQTWFYFTRMIDAGTMGGDSGQLNRLVSTVCTIVGVVVAGLLISSLSGNFQERLEAIKRGGSPVMEEDHFLILGWSEKIYSVVDQLAEAYLPKKIVVVVMADADKIEMETKLRDKIVHQQRVKLVVRSGSSLSLNDLARVSFDRARAIVVLVDEADVDQPDKADGRIIKTLLALFNHPDSKSRVDRLRVTAEVMLAQSQEIALIASGGRAHVVKTNEIISRIILQTSRISGLSIVYDELLRFEGNEIHVKQMPVVGRRFGDILLDFPNALPVGVARMTGGHLLNPPADHVIQQDEALLLLAEDANIQFTPYPVQLPRPTLPTGGPPGKPQEHMLILGWNNKIFPILEEFDSYVAAGSSVTLVNTLTVDERVALLTEKVPEPKNIAVHHLVGEFTSRKLLEQLQPQRYPTVMVLGDATTEGRDVEESDTRAIIALLLLRDFRQRAGILQQEVCSEILDPKNRELAATTDIRDVVISNEMVSMVLAQITYEPRIRPILEDLFRSEGSEIYIKDLALYCPLGQPTTFEQLVLAAKARGEVALGLQVHEDSSANRYGLRLNPNVQLRRTPFLPKPKDRLVVLAEDDA